MVTWCGMSTKWLPVQTCCQETTIFGIELATHQSNVRHETHVKIPHKYTTACMKNERLLTHTLHSIPSPNLHTLTFTPSLSHIPFVLTCTPSHPHSPTLTSPLFLPAPPHPSHPHSPTLTSPLRSYLHPLIPHILTLPPSHPLFVLTCTPSSLISSLSHDHTLTLPTCTSLTPPPSPHTPSLHTPSLTSLL